MTMKKFHRCSLWRALRHFWRSANLVSTNLDFLLIPVLNSEILIASDARILIWSVLMWVIQIQDGNYQILPVSSSNGAPEWAFLPFLPFFGCFRPLIGFPMYMKHSNVFLRYQPGTDCFWLLWVTYLVWRGFKRAPNWAFLSVSANF